MENRHLRPSISIALMAVVIIAAYIAIGTENALLCVLSASIAITGLFIGNKLGA